MAEGTRIVTRFAFVPPSHPPHHKTTPFLKNRNMTNSLPRTVLTENCKTELNELNTKLVLQLLF